MARRRHAPPRAGAGACVRQRRVHHVAPLARGAHVRRHPWIVPVGRGRVNAAPAVEHRRGRGGAAAGEYPRHAVVEACRGEPQRPDWQAVPRAVCTRACQPATSLLGCTPYGFHKSTYADASASRLRASPLPLSCARQGGSRLTPSHYPLETPTRLHTPTSSFSSAPPPAPPSVGTITWTATSGRTRGRPTRTAC